MQPERPNILLIMSDQHHAGVMGCAGDSIAQTPNMDRLAREGVLFSHAYCSYPLCGPSRMSFMTGRHPHEINQWDNQCQLSSDIPTFAHALLSEGYDTVLAGRMHFVGADQRHGFARRIIGDVPPTAHITAGWQLDKVVGNLVDTCGMGRSAIVKSGPGRTGYQAYDEAVTRTTVDWLQERGRVGQENPFLLTVGYVTPHCPFVAPPDDFETYREAFPIDSLPRSDEDLHPRNALLRKYCGIDPAPPTDAQWRARTAYYGLCSFLDRQIGAVTAALENSGLGDNTMIVYCSDHGEMLGEHGMWWKGTFYDGACRVPLIVSLPASRGAGVVRAENVSLMDVGPTLLDLAGVGPLPGASGRSFRTLLDDTGAVWDDTVFAEYSVGTVCRMVRSGPWKYNYYRGMGGELFNLQDDPGETRNLAGQARYHEVEERLRVLVLRDWDHDYVEACSKRWECESRLVADWIRAANPPEPDPVWFDQPPENWVNNQIVAHRATISQQSPASDIPGATPEE